MSDLPIIRLCTNLNPYDEATIEDLLKGFDADYVAHVREMKHLQGQKERTIAYKLLVECLQECGLYNEKPHICYSEKGQPFLSNYPGLFLSISHCKVAVAVAVSDRPIGIDIESVRAYKPGLVDRSFSTLEQQEIESSPNRDLSFTRLWTRKEAYLKFIGTGITGFDNLQSIPPATANIETRQLSNGAILSICQEATLISSI